MKKLNALILILVFLLLLIKLFLSTINFPTSFENSLLRTLTVLFTLGLLFFLKMKKWTKVLYIAGYLMITYVIGYLDLWKLSTSRFIDKNINEMSAVVNHLNKDFNECEFKILGDGSWRINHDCDTTKIDITLINTLKGKIGKIEIDKNNDLILLTFDRFIDNGYGIAWIDEGKVEKIKTETRYRINGLEITSLVHLKDNWYYLSFT